MNAPHVDILLAAYNGAAYLAEQLDSILGQSHGNWTLRVRDDGSSDGTRAILADYRGRHPDRIKVVEDNGRKLGVRGNFGRLLEEARGYVMFSDQDDVWLADKTARTLAGMLEAESGAGKGTPVLVHTDMKVVDERLKVLSGSFVEYQRLDPMQGTSLPRLLMQNTVTGCTVMINEELRKLALPIPEDCVMHDWWMALVAAAFGKVAYAPETTMLYRQHGGNDTGAKEWSAGYMLQKAASFYDTRDFRKNLDMTQRQAGAFLAQYGNRLPDRAHAALSAFCGMRNRGWLDRRLAILRHGFYKTGLVRNLGLLMRV